MTDMIDQTDEVCLRLCDGLPGSAHIIARLLKASTQILASTNSFLSCEFVQATNKIFKIQLNSMTESTKVM